MARAEWQRWHVASLYCLVSSCLHSVLVYGAPQPLLTTQLNDSGDRGQSRLKPVTLMKDPSPNSQRLEYRCWDPATGLSSPVVTILTILTGHNQGTIFASKNRKAYILRHGYRYCEIATPADPTRLVAWTKLPAILALLPCTEFLIHIDGDALLVNHEYSFDPWIGYMQDHKVDLLLSADCIPESPINFGVFAVRHSAWLLRLFKDMYNRCACDWSRLHDWPAEQGFIYDLLVEQREEAIRWRNKTAIVQYTGWNRFWNKKHDAEFNIFRRDDLVTHMTNVPRFEGRSNFHGQDTCLDNTTCKFSEMQTHYEHAVREGRVSRPLDFDQDSFVKAPKCLNVEYHPLANSSETYTNRGDNLESSFLDWQLSAAGYVTKIMIGEIPCVGYRESKCSLHRYWDVDTGRGPWMPSQVELHTYHDEHPPPSTTTVLQQH